MAINFPSTAGQATDGSFTYNVAGIVYAWNGSSWAAAGAGASATDTSLFNVTTNSPSGTGQLTYTAGTFSYTPPNLSGYITAETDTLATVTARGATTSANLTLGGTVQFNNEISVADNKVLNFGTSSDGRIAYVSSTNRFYVRTPGGTADLILGAGPATRITNENGLTDRAVFTASGATITGTLTAGGLTYPNSNGSLNQVLTSDGVGNVTWTSAGLSARDTSAMGLLNIANGGDATPNISTPKTYALLSVQTTHAVWVTLYNSDAARTADNTRGINTDPIPGTGVLAEVITTGAQTQYLSPGVICYNIATTGITYAKVRNLSGATNAINVTLTHVKLEA
jgi:hypothetical protein